MVKGQIIHQIFGADTAGRHPFQSLIGAGDGFELGHTAVLLGGEKLDRLQPKSHGLFHLAWGSGTGQDQPPLGLYIAHGIGVEAGTDNKFGPGRQGPVHLFMV